jgi:hypothetical protein
MELHRIAPADIAGALGLSEASAWSFAHNIERHYKEPRLQKVGRKERLIDALYAPGKKKLRKLHQWFLENRLYHPFAHGGMRHRSCFTSATRHLDARGIWTRDASDCFPNVKPDAFYKELTALGFRHDTARLLTLLCTIRNRLPQGSPVSNDALNLFFWRADAELASQAIVDKCRYTRVADDFVVSSRGGLRGARMAKIVEDQLAARDIPANKKKRRQSGFQSNAAVQTVHNINVSLRHGTAIVRKHLIQARNLAEVYVRACRSVQADTLESVASKRQSLAGWMYYCRQAKYSPAKTLYTLIRAGDRHVERKLAAMEISAYKGRWWVVCRSRNEPRRIARVWRSRKSGTLAAPSAA